MKIWLVCFFLLAACGSHSIKNNEALQIGGLLGEIDSDFLRRYEASAAQIELYYVASTGGSVDIAISIAEQAREHGHKAIVTGFCLSACAEILILGFHEIKFENSPIIGFHGNSYMKNHLYRIHTGQSESTCFLENQERRDLLYILSGTNRNFWQEQLFRINPHDTYVVRSDSPCGLLGYDLEVDYWFPTSAQLRNEFGLSFTGQVAADDADFAMMQISELFLPGAIVMIGDEVRAVP